MSIGLCVENLRSLMNDIKKKMSTEKEKKEKKTKNRQLSHIYESSIGTCFIFLLKLNQMSLSRKNISLALKGTRV